MMSRECIQRWKIWQLFQVWDSCSPCPTLQGFWRVLVKRTKACSTKASRNQSPINENILSANSFLVLRKNPPTRVKARHFHMLKAKERFSAEILLSSIRRIPDICGSKERTLLVALLMFQRFWKTTHLESLKSREFCGRRASKADISPSGFGSV